MNASEWNLPALKIFEKPPALSAADAWAEYLNDSYQRTILFLAILRQRPISPSDKINTVVEKIRLDISPFKIVQTENG